MKHAKTQMRSLAATLAKAAPPPGRPAAPPVLTPLTIKLTPAVVDRIFQEVARRKRDRVPNRSIQAVVTEAVLAYLDGDGVAHGKPEKQKAGKLASVVYSDVR